MNAHTPGPWFFGQTEAQKKTHIKEQQWSIYITSSEHGIMGCRGEEYMCVSGICKEADARLIAAAPDLLAALTEIASGHSMAGEEMARKAIAKATGGEL
jgi:hypothetical protein